MLPLHSHDSSKKGRGGIRPYLDSFRLLLSDRNSRNLLGFLVLNLSFAFVELFYGIWTNSLGLISDSFHMFFDCTGLVAGLAASIIVKWKPNERFSYGYVRAEVLAGFVNGLFLLFISFFIFSEAVERLVEPPEVKHERLFLVSVLGLLVNLVGIFIFNHGGATGSHGHSHDGNHGHGHSHGHNGHSGNAQIMKGVFLHILADTLGSVGVIVSAILMHFFNWMIADPICSIFIAVLIALSVGTLLSESVSILMQRQPKELDHALPEVCNKIMSLDGVQGVQETHFWTLSSNVWVGGLKLEVGSTADPKYIISHSTMLFRSIGVNQVYIQLDYEYNKSTYANLQNF